MKWVSPFDMLKQRTLAKMLGGLIIASWFGFSLSTVADEVDTYVKSEMQAQHIPGLSLAVIRNGRVVKTKGYGLANLELDAPAKVTTVYHLASLTKQLTATAVMLLVQDGKVDLDDRISRYLENTPDSWSKVTVRHLLNNTSGIKDYLNEMQTDTRNGTNPEEIASAMGKLPMNFEPGTQYGYSNTGYLLAGLIIQNICGKSFEVFLGDRVFKPLGMVQTRRNHPDEIVRNRAAGYFWTEGTLRNSPFVHTTLYDNADDGLISSVVDMAKWDAALDGDSILNRSSRTLMWTPVKLASGATYPYGLGWELSSVNGHRMMFHKGNRVDTATFMARYPDDKLSIIVLCNRGDASAGRIARQVAGIYVRGLRQTADAEPRVAELVKATLLQLQEGRITAEPFTPEMWKDLYPRVTSMLEGMLKSRGAFKSLTLLSREQKGNNRYYELRAMFGDTSLLVQCTFTPEDKISEMSLGPE